MVKTGVIAPLVHSVREERILFDEDLALLYGVTTSDTSRPFPKPQSGRIAVKVINHLGDEVMKVFRV